MLPDAFPLLFALFSFSDFFSDMMLVLRIFVLLTIISFVVMHLGKGPLAIVLIVGISYFVLFGAFWFFGGVYVLMMLMMFGVSGILIDFFFIKGPAGGNQSEAPISHGIDLMQKRGGMMQQRRLPPGGGMP
ncbi:MAG: hypothetical protein Q8N60_01080 [Candidatus Diapherotrites archaeon]|nr:hypothetical protein [Candidatus Diapherotrites archaeon]